jgi:hypothetical protein
MAPQFTTLLLSALSTCLGIAAAQAGIGDLPAAGQCNLATLSPRVATVQARCCSQGGGCSCAMPCATTLLPLLDDCRPTLDIMLDMNDGTRDGVAGQLDELRAQCLAIPSAEVVAELKTMHDAGMCSNAMLDGVARTEVGAAPCVDVNTHCDILIAGGIDCGEQEMITGCRATCGTCDDDGGGKRRAQITSSCPLKDFDTQASAVNDACCDDADCQGVPTVCDAKCAVVFDGFFDRCSSILGLQMPDQMPGFTSLHTTCSTQLPVEPLLRAVIECSVQSRVEAINANDYSSWATMEAAGWTWDAGAQCQGDGPRCPAAGHAVDQHCRGTTPQGAPNFYIYTHDSTVGTLSLVLPVDGSGTIDFGDCSADPGTVVLAINGVQVEMADPNTNSVVKGIKFSAGDVLTLQDQGFNSVIRLNSIHISTPAGVPPPPADDDPCQPTPCQNGGGCDLGSPGYICECRAGYMGVHCDTDIDECSSAPCLNRGTCTDGAVSYSCTCSDGYAGDNCGYDVDECSSAPCLNRGTCTDGADSYSCTCSDGYAGDNCAEHNDPCATVDCDQAFTVSDSPDPSINGVYFPMPDKLCADSPVYELCSGGHVMYQRDSRGNGWAGTWIIGPTEQATNCDIWPSTTEDAMSVMTCAPMDQPSDCAGEWMQSVPRGDHRDIGGGWSAETSLRVVAGCS